MVVTDNGDYCLSLPKNKLPSQDKENKICSRYDATAEAYKPPRLRPFF